MEECDAARVFAVASGLFDLDGGGRLRTRGHRVDTSFTLLCSMHKTQTQHMDV